MVDLFEDVKSESEREFEFSFECLVVMVEEFLESEINEKYSCGWLLCNFDDRLFWISSVDEDIFLFFVVDFYVYLQYVCLKE